MASRDHLAFVFYGLVTTWRTFEYALDYFRHFFPMSRSTSLDDEEIGKQRPNDYYLMMMVGTSDFSYSYDRSRAEKRRNNRYFKEQTQENDGIFIIRTKKAIPMTV